MLAYSAMNDPSSKPPRLLDQMREALRLRHYSLRTEQAYTHWTKRYIYLHGKRHPPELGPKEVEDFLSALAVQVRVSASTQGQVRAKRPQR